MESLARWLASISVAVDENGAFASKLRVSAMPSAYVFDERGDFMETGMMIASAHPA
jgi:hypothetical protein